MASALYNKYKEEMLNDGSAATSLVSSNVKAILVSSAYTFSQSHKFLSDVTGIVSTSGNMTNPTVTDGVYDVDNWTWTAVTGAECIAVIHYIDTGVAGTSILLSYLDSDSVTGLPLTPNSGDVNFLVAAQGLWAL